MSANKIQLIIDAVNRAGGKIDQVEKQIGDLEKRTQRAQQRMKGFATGVSVATAGIVAMGMAAKKTFEFAREGAVLDQTKTKFDRLALTINTTGAALESKLVKAMDGLVSRMDAVNLGTDLLSLGLVKSEEEAVRMARAVGQLGMDMNQLVLTLTNQTTMRFDSLGVSVDGFKDKVNELERAGMDADAAFRMAFIEQAEEQIDKVGDVADTAAGAFMRLDSNIKNATDAFKQQVSEGLTPFVEAVNIAWERKVVFNEAIKMGALEVEFAEEWERQIAAGLISHAESLALVIELMGSYTDSLIRNSPELEKYVGLQNAAARAAGMTPAGAYRPGGTGALWSGQSGTTQKAVNDYFGAVGVSGGSLSSMPGFAGGGKLPARGPALVGERGPEMIVNGYVIPSGPTQQLLSRGVIPGGRFADGGHWADEYTPDWASEDVYSTSVYQKPYSGHVPIPPTNTLYDPAVFFQSGGKQLLPGGSPSASVVAATPAVTAPPPPPVSIADIAAQTESTAASVGVQMAQVIASEFGKDAQISNQLQSEMLDELRKLPKVKDFVLAIRNAVEQAVQ